MSPRLLRLVVAGLPPLALIASMALAALLLRADLDAAGRAALAAVFTSERLAMLALVLLPALALLGWTWWRRAAAQRAAGLRLAGQIRVVTRANPAQRVAPPGQPALDAIAVAANELAEERSRLQAESQATIAQAMSRVEDERNRFAALVAELEQSVLVCNRDGTILLFNEAARSLLAVAGGERATHAVGLGRSAFGVLDRDLVMHALEKLDAQVGRGERANAHFVAALRGGSQLRVNVAPVLRGSGAGAEAQAALAVTGFVLLLQDITESVERDARSLALFQDLVDGTRSAIAHIRAAIGAMIEQPALDAPDRAGQAQIVQAQAARLAERLESVGSDMAARLRRNWPVEEIRGVDLLALACRRIGRRDGFAASIDRADPELWMRVDSFTLVQAVSSLAGRLHEEFAVRDIRFRLQAAGQQVHLDLAWKGAPMSSETAFTWQNDSFTHGGEDSPLSLAQVMERHGGQAWYQRDTPSQTNLFRLALPLAPERPSTLSRTPLPARPEFYDFDLFHRSGTAALDERRLKELSYTVFDTETTGLEPGMGDELVSIGAVRIVNGRLLRSETFETLVDPCRSVPAQAVAVHGITPERLAGQPKILDVLPRFHGFCEDTVLVGHNAAFDLRFLQLKEAQTGVCFRQPVLDTLLLAAVVSPAEPSQSLEAIAERLGVAIVGRHTALGDALATAEVFLKLLPLLAGLGIETLGQARAASERTYYARLNY